VNHAELYDIADALAIKLDIDGRNITGGKPRTLKAGDFVMKLPCKVIAFTAPFSGAGVLVHVAGDLGIFVGRDKADSVFTAIIVDLSRLPDRGEDFFAKNRPQSINAAISRLTPHTEGLPVFVWTAGRWV
jgi:hypothetical protein